MKYLQKEMVKYIDYVVCYLFLLVSVLVGLLGQLIFILETSGIRIFSGDDNKKSFVRILDNSNQFWLLKQFSQTK